jgi:hypothetical protein
MTRIAKLSSPCQTSCAVDTNLSFPIEHTKPKTEIPHRVDARAGSPRQSFEVKTLFVLQKRELCLQVCHRHIVRQLSIEYPTVQLETRSLIVEHFQVFLGLLGSHTLLEDLEVSRRRKVRGSLSQTRQPQVGISYCDHRSHFRPPPTRENNKQEQTWARTKMAVWLVSSSEFSDPWHHPRLNSQFPPARPSTGIARSNLQLRCGA